MLLDDIDTVNQRKTLKTVDIEECSDLCNFLVAYHLHKLHLLLGYTNFSKKRWSGAI